MTTSIEVFNRYSTQPIYTGQIEIFFDEDTNTYVVERKGKVLGNHHIETLALASAGEEVLSTFRQPGFYTAKVKDTVVAQKEVN